MKRMLLFNVRLILALAMVLASVSALGQNISNKELRQATKYFAKKQADYGIPVLKGAEVGNPIPSLGASYCTEGGYVDIVPDEIDPRATTIEWTITTFVGAAEQHPGWAELIGTGTNAVLRFYPDRVTDQYYNVAIYFEYVQRNNLGLIVGSNYDFTNVNKTPTEFDLTPTEVSICVGETATLTLSGSEVGMDYQLYHSNGDAVRFPINGNGSAINFSVSVSDSYYVEAVNRTDNSCSSLMNGTAVVTVNPLPTPVAGNGGDVCLGSPMELAAASDEYNSYIWTNAAGETVATTQNATLSSEDYGAGSHVFTLTVEDVNLCVNSTSTTITVFENPTAAPTFNAPVCDGGELVIAANAAGGTG
ncbi:hypothetical protein, partial [Carboxylicivirga taeanensis]|uniref:Ig-like domain-containing protein n=1 Tax=Carboxylicivirga taeanensis TaxID=1416875 RepID=UPI003F6DE033